MCANIRNRFPVPFFSHCLAHFSCPDFSLRSTIVPFPLIKKKQHLLSMLIFSGCKEEEKYCSLFFVCLSLCVCVLFVNYNFVFSYFEICANRNKFLLLFLLFSLSLCHGVSYSKKHFIEPFNITSKLIILLAIST